MNRTLLGLSLLLSLGACGGEAEGPPAPATGTPAASTATPEATAAPTEAAATPATSTEKMAWNDSMGTASVTGSVKFSGTAPARVAIDMGSDASCHGMHSGETLEETLIVDGSGGIQNVFVWVKKGLSNYTFETPSEPVTLDQSGCVYVPHVLGMMKGQGIQVSNGDEVTHNVHSYSKKNSSFNMSQPAGSPSIEKVMNRDEGMFKVACDIHSWMSSYIGVVKTPFFAVTSSDGSFDLGKLPAGDYTISAQHETLGTETMKITVADGGSETVAFEMSK